VRKKKGFGVQKKHQLELEKKKKDLSFLGKAQLTRVTGCASQRTKWGLK